MLVLCNEERATPYGAALSVRVNRGWLLGGWFRILYKLGGGEKAGKGC